MKYRKDIDGLRAVAVAAVVLFHAGLFWVPGGFVGVDIFFVISGYLITRLLMNEMATGHYSIQRFYLRRARRILPALYVVTVATLLLGMVLLPPLELMALSNTAMAVQFFSSNFLFWLQSGYFDALSELKPLLHTWSLSVEEQFYIVWPLTLYLCFRRAWSIHWVVAGMMGLSFALSCLYLVQKPAAVFYLLPGRAWELLLGAWVATVAPNGFENRVLKEAMAAAGLVLVVASVFLLDKSMPFPGWSALLPCAGAAFLIAAGPGSIVDRYLLSIRPMVFVGLISYSLYLWHWPLLAYVRAINLGMLPGAQASVALLGATILATLSWQFVEKPFRHARQKQQPGAILLKYALAGFSICMVVWVLIASDGLPGRIPERAVAAQAAAMDFNSSRGVCHLNMEQVRVAEVDKCTTTRGSAAAGGVVAVWGDSHAEAIIPGVTAMPVLAGMQLLQLTKTSCPPLLEAVVVRGGKAYSECSQFNENAVRLLRERNDITTVVLSARWPVYVLESGFGVPEENRGAPTYALKSAGNVATGRTKSADEMAVALGRTIDALTNAGKKVIVIGAIPEMRYDVPTCVARRRMSMFPSMSCELDQNQVALRIAGVNQIIRHVALPRHAAVLLPDGPLCRGGRCAVEGPLGEILYYDHNHLSRVGARYVFAGLRPQE